MNRSILTALAVVIVVVLGLVFSTLFTVGQAQQALVLQFGQPVRVIETPGLHVKIPFVQNVVYFDRRLLDFDADAQEVIMADQKRMVVDAFARYRIVDPLLFYQTAQTEQNMRLRLSAIVTSRLRDVLGSVQFSAVLTARRAELMRQISESVVTESKTFGVQVYDVRIMRADLHPDNSQAIYDRMKTERQREARQERAEGEETALRIRAEADRDRTVILAEAQRESQRLRGQGDAKATDVFAAAFNRDPEFYAFYRSLQAYRNSMGDGSATLLLAPDSDFFRYFRDLRGTAPQTPAAAPRPPAR